MAKRPAGQIGIAPRLRTPAHSRRPAASRPAGPSPYRRTDSYTAAATHARRTRQPLNGGVLILFIVMATMVILSVMALLHPADSGRESAVTGAVTAAPAVTEPLTRSVFVPMESMHTGPLILVNYRYAYTFPDDVIIESVNEHKSDWYITWYEYELESTTLNALNRLIDDFHAAVGCGKTLMNSGYRSYEEQAEIYRSTTSGYATEPGHSEHHTGMALDIQIYDPKWGNGRKNSWYFNEYDDADWLVAHFADYGFILRYPTEKVNLTRIEYESWHYRYIGTPHAAICNALDDCLEEYIEYLETMTFDTRRLWWDGTAATVLASDEPLPERGYLIYFVPASGGSATEIPLPAGIDAYEISGDNAGGFIVTVTLDR